MENQVPQGFDDNISRYEQSISVARDGGGILRPRAKYYQPKGRSHQKASQETKNYCAAILKKSKVAAMGSTWTRCDLAGTEPDQWVLVEDPSEVLRAEAQGQEIIYCSNSDDLFEEVVKKYQGNQFIEVTKYSDRVATELKLRSDSSDSDYLFKLAKEHPEELILISNKAVRNLLGFIPARRYSDVVIVAPNDEYFISIGCKAEYIPAGQDREQPKNWLTYDPKSASHYLKEQRLKAKDQKKTSAASFPGFEWLFKILRSAIANHLLIPEQTTIIDGRTGGAQLIHPDGCYLSTKYLVPLCCRLISSSQLLKINLLKRKDYRSFLKKISPYLTGMLKQSKEKKMLAKILIKHLKIIDD